MNATKEGMEPVNAENEEFVPAWCAVSMELCVMLAVVLSVFHAPGHAVVVNVFVVALAASAACFWALMRSFLHRWLFHLPVHVLAGGILFACGVGISGGPVLIVAALVVLLVVMSGFTETQMARVLVALGGAAALRSFVMLTVLTPGVRAGGEVGMGAALTESSYSPSLVLSAGTVALLVCAGRWLIIEVVNVPKSDLMHSRLNRNIAPGVMSALAALAGCAAIATAFWFENFLWAVALGVAMVVVYLLLATLTRSVPAWFGLPLLVLCLGFAALNFGRPTDQGFAFDSESFSRNVESLKYGAGDRVTSQPEGAETPKPSRETVGTDAVKALELEPVATRPEAIFDEDPRFGMLAVVTGVLFLIACAYEGFLGALKFPPPVRTLAVGGLVGVCGALVALFLIPANLVGGLFVALSPLLALASLRGDFEEELEEEME